MLIDSVTPINMETQLKEKVEALEEKSKNLQEQLNKANTEAKKCLTKIKTIEWENRNLKQVLQRKELELEGLKLKNEMQNQANEGLFRELEKTIEMGRIEGSVANPNEEMSQRLNRLSLESALQIPDNYSRCDRSILPIMLEEQVKYLT